MSLYLIADDPDLDGFVADGLLLLEAWLANRLAFELYCEARSV